ncbi:MAG TPA: hypothetical protein VFZ32_10020 [Micromonosporaceae bacterium]
MRHGRRRRLVDEGIRRELAPFAAAGNLVGLSCLADGADQMFARAVLDAGGALEAVIPADRYRDGLPEEAHAAYDELLAAASAVHRLGHVESTSTAHMDASADMLKRADRLFAVWDGLPARGYGGTADVVTHARKLNLPVTVIWPEGVARN